MPYAQLPEIKLHYIDQGAGEPIIFLHGFSLDHRQWQHEIDVFSQTHRVIVPDSRGHGLSDAPETNYSRDHRAEDLAKLVDTLEIGRFHLVGLSMGGATAIGYALKDQSDLASLTLVSTAAAGYQVSRKFDRLDKVARADSVEAAKQKWMDWSLAWYKDRHQDVGRKIAEMMNDFGGAIWADPMRGKYPKATDLDRVHEITVPTLIVAGELDKVFAALAEQLHERISDSTLLLYPETGHMVNLEAPDRFCADLKAFLEATS